MAEAVNIPIAKLALNTGQIEGLPKNPRFIRDERFAKLVQSIKDDPEMMALRELLAYPTGKEFVVIGGNMRLRALKELGYKEAPCKVLDKATPVAKLRAYTIKDNIGFGDHDWEALAADWDAGELSDWGLDLPADLAQDDAEEQTPSEASEELYKPYSVINRTQGPWQDRQDVLRALFPKERGREAPASDMDRLVLHTTVSSSEARFDGVSEFDPCLAEWAYTLFAPKSILDPFCGGPPRGYVAAMMGITYKGFDVRAEQIAANMQRVDQFGKPPHYVHSCYSKHVDGETYDMVLTCPPYGDLEVYSKQGDDISAMKPDQFEAMYKAILSKAWERINAGGHMAIVIGNYRRKKSYVDLEVMTKAIMTECGGDIIGDCIVVDPIGSKAMIGKPHLERYGLITRCHQYMIIARKQPLKQP